MPNVPYRRTLQNSSTSLLAGTPKTNGCLPETDRWRRSVVGRHTRGNIGGVEHYVDSVSYYCSWVKPRFDSYIAIKIGKRESCSLLDEPIKSWLEVGDQCYGGSPEWHSLRYYILEKYEAMKNIVSHIVSHNSEITSKELTDDEWAEKVRKDCEDILKGNK